ncbi:hypothetical protein HNP46_006199 [Pseudomonas nitritireducens]|uniref:Uncharacterized protein n=1 Tax=Pseudomonas nitroreducens TaxID=46680 RepID=A0A7W7KS30_PSENT|nr:hypothetical protein [Pseudomonas nitritireducens]MBB4867288.1 hypothetical protein [Pseudomonas nitritireducens]
MRCKYPKSKSQRSLLERANDKFLDEMDKFKHEEFYPLQYEICEAIKEHEWHIPLMEISISGDLKEAINKIHQWYNTEKHWKCWERAISSFKLKDAWTIRNIYIESLSQYCLLQPSATRDRFGTIATTALHQANLQLIEKYEDKLDSDKRGFLTRPDREKQLKRLGMVGNWKEAQGFLTSLSRLDDNNYKKKTYNFRNLASHGISPRIEIGETNFVTREITNSTYRSEQQDGSYLVLEDPSKKSVTYGIGGTSPLNPSETLLTIDTEIKKTIEVFNSYKKLLLEITSRLPRTESK